MKILNTKIYIKIFYNVFKNYPFHKNIQIESHKAINFKTININIDIIYHINKISDPPLFKGIILTLN